MTNALTQGAYQTPLSRDPITARYRAFGRLYVPKTCPGLLSEEAAVLAQRSRLSVLFWPLCVPKTSSEFLCD
jgi:hypothetical protein